MNECMQQCLAHSNQRLATIIYYNFDIGVKPGMYEKW